MGGTEISVCLAGDVEIRMLTIELPTQMPMVSSILFFIAIHTEVTCSAAFAYKWRSVRTGYGETWRGKIRTTMGRRIRPMNGLGMWYRSAVSSMDATTSQFCQPTARTAFQTEALTVVRAE